MPLSDALVLSSSDPVPDVPPGSLIDLIYEKFDSFPADKVALLDDASGRSFSFRNLKRLTGQVASGLTKRGFGKGHVLSLVSDNCIENAPIAHGAILTGGTLHLVKPQASKEEFQFYFNLARPLIIVTTAADAVLEAVRAIALDVKDIYVIGATVEGCRRAEELLEDPGDANPWGRVAIDPREDVAVMMLTGGTTGISKTIPITHDAFKLSILEATEMMEITLHQQSLCCSAFYHIGAFLLLHGTWLRRGCGVVNMSLKNNSPEAILRAMEKHKITNVLLFPALLKSLEACPFFAKTDLTSLQNVILTGAALSKKDETRGVSKLKAAAPKAKVYQGYGLTELAGPTTLTPLSSHVKFKHKVGSSGILLPSVEMEILSCDEQRKPCKAGEMGEILLRTPKMLKGYLKNDEATRKAIVDGWYHTGDYGYFDEDEYVFIIDRANDLIKHKDGIILPTHVEGVLRSHPDIKECAVIGRRSEKGGEEAMAFVVRREGCDVTEEAVRRFGAERLTPPEQLSGGVRFVESIPKSPIGKVLRRELSPDL